MPLINGRSDFDEQFFSKNTSISKGTDIFTLGGDFFSVKTNLDDRKIRDISQLLDNFSDPITIDGIIPTNNVDLTYEKFTSVELNFDKTILTNHAYFGSLKEKFRYSVTNIVSTFPASIYVNNDYNQVLLTILGYVYNPISNLASFKIPLNAITNNYNLKITDVDNLFSTGTTQLRNLPKSYSKYSLWNFVDEFPLTGLTGTTITDNYVYVEVLGNPFPTINSSGLENFHIKPNHENYTNFLKNLDSFQGYLLNLETSPKFTATFQVPNFDSEGNNVVVEENFTWKTTDGYNLDYDTYEFQVYIEALDKIAKNIDEYKSNLVSRYLTSSSIKEFDTEDQRTEKLLMLYGKQFDDIKQYIDSLAYISTVTYDKKDNIPDVLVKNFARTLGWGTFSTVTEKDLMKSFLGQQSAIEITGKSKNLTPVETDIELWRRLVINSSFLFKSKGTRECIDFLFKIVGAPKSLVDFNEYVYIAENIIDVNVIENDDILNFPFDSEGYPKVIENTSDYYFQMKGGWISNKEIAPTNDKNYASVIGIHTGEYDGGSSYFKNFTNFEGQEGFQLTRVVDNVKSWSSTNNTHINVNKETGYIAQDRRMVLNSKEASVYMNPARAVETDVYEYNKLSGLVINPNSLSYPYPDNELTRADVNSMSYIQYIDFIYSRFINVKNRKTIETFGNGYPTLKKIFEDYLTIGQSTSKNLTVNKVLRFIEQLGDFWLNLIEQFIPSTTIWQGGVVYKNTIFDRQKFDYKQGINDGSEFESKQPLNPEFKLTIGQIQGSVGLPYAALIKDLGVANAAFTTTLTFPDDNGNGIGDNATDRGILRIKPFFSSDLISIVQPCLTMGKVSKILTGTTAPIIHNISLGNKEVDINFDCNLKFFSDGGNFMYNIFKFDNTVQEFTPTATFSHITPNFTSTGATYGFTDTINYSFGDGDYLIKPSFKISQNLTGDTHANILEYYTRVNNIGILNNTGFNLSGTTLTFDSTNVNRTTEYGIYDDNSDYWFSIVSVPFKPNINTNLVGSNNPASLSGATLVNAVLPILTNLQKIFYLNENPSGDVLLSVNGSTLQKSDSINFTTGEYYGESIGSTYKITLAPNINVYLVDTISVVYLKTAGSSSFSSIHGSIGAIPSGTTATSGILFNTSTNNFEYYLPFELNKDVEFTQMIVALNGNILNIYSDYYMLGTEPTKIIFSSTIASGDDILIYYPNNGGSNFISSKQFSASWNVQNDASSGKYVVEVSLDEGFSTIMISAETPYIPSVIPILNNYNLFVGIFSIPNMTYYYRVNSIKNNINLLGEITTTQIYSNIVSFKTDNRVLV